MKKHIIYLIYFNIKTVKLSQTDWFQIDHYFHYILFYHCYLKLTIKITSAFGKINISFYLDKKISI